MTIARDRYSTESFAASPDYGKHVSLDCGIPLSDAHLALLERESSWLQFDVPLGELGFHDPERVLSVNRRLPGGTKICLSSVGIPRLRLEVAAEPLTSEETASRTSQAVATLTRSLHFLEKLGSAPVAVDQVAVSGSTVDIAGFCGAAGWNCMPREGGRWIVELHAAPEYCQAEILVIRDELSIEVCLGEWETVGELNYKAALDLLIKACSRIRACRAAIEPYGIHGVRFLLMANVAQSEMGTDLLPALSALSVGFSRLQRELSALQFIEIAEAYLAISSRHAGREHTHR